MRNTLLLIAWLVPAMHFAQTLDSPNVATGYLDQAESFMIEEDYETATVFYKKAATLFQKLEMWKHYYSCLTNLAKAGLLSENYEEAKKYAKEALWGGLKKFGEYNENSATAAHLLAQVYEESGAYEKAELVHKTGLGIHKSLYGEGHPSVANSYEELGIFFGARGEYPEALKWLEIALSIRITNFGEDHLDVGQSLYKIAEIQVLSQNLQDAVKNHQQALAIRQAQLDNNHPEVLISLSKTIQALMQKGKLMLLPEQESDFQQAYESFCLADQLLDQHDGKLLANEDNWNNFDIALELYQAGIVTAFELFQQTNESRYIDQALIFSEKSKTYTFFKASSSGYLSSNARRPDSTCRRQLEVAIDQLRQNYLSPKKALISYYIGGSNCYIFTITKSKAWLDKIQYDESLKANVEQFNKAILEVPDVQSLNLNTQSYQLFVSSAYQLFQILVKPAIDHLPPTTKSLMIVPDGNFGFLPFESFLLEMPQESQNVDYRNLSYLLRSFNMAYTPSIQALNHCPNQEKDLSGIAFVPLGDQANIPLKAQKERTPDKPMAFQTVALKGGEGNTGLDQIEQTSKRIAALFYAQSSSVVLNIWKAPEEQITDWQLKFFKYLEEGKAKDEALQLIKLQYLNDPANLSEHLHPYFWAGFVMVGDTSPLYSHKDRNSNWYLLAAFGAFLAFFYFFQKKIKRLELFRPHN